MINKIKLKLHAVIFWQTSLGEIANKLYDLKIFYKYSFTNNKSKSKKSEKAFLTKQYHIIEKGLALPKPRLEFGKEKINILINRSEKYIEEYGEDELTHSINNCLKEYLKFNNIDSKESKNPFFLSIQKFINNKTFEKNGGTILIEKNKLKEITDIPYEAFVKSRYSVRDFALTDVDTEQIKKAINIAKYAPSVCNRQSWAAHLYTNKAQMLDLLKLQGGNNGFTESINKLIIVTTDTKSFTKLESNQVYVDGGLFSMSLILALHSLGLGACCLNTCFPYTTEKKVKLVGDISENEKLIMMIGIGNLKDFYKVAISNKKQLSELLEIH